ncbi:MAG: DNA gyrase inhibitor YacG [Methylocella sp.]
MPVAKPDNPLSGKAAGSPAKPCPICGKPGAFVDRPFCSRRCAEIDLHRWLGGVYAIPAAHESDTEPDGARRP